MPEGMIYGLLDGGSSQLLWLPRLAASSSEWKEPAPHPCKWMGLPKSLILAGGCSVRKSAETLF